MNTYTLQQIINGYRAIQDINNSPVIVPGALLFQIEDIKTILEPKCINFDKSKKAILESDSEKKNDEILKILSSKHELNINKVNKEDLIKLSLPSTFVTLFKPFID